MSSRVLVYLIFVIAAALVAWVVSGSYSRTETARGILVTAQGSTKIHALRPGQVNGLYVSEGDIVRAGQRLALIGVEHGGDTGQSRVAESLASLARQENFASEQIRLIREGAASERSRLAATISGLRRQRSDLLSQIALQGEAVASAGDLFRRVEAISQSGFVSRLEVERRRQAWLAMLQEQGRLRQQLGSLQAEEERAVAESGRAAAEAGSAVAAAQGGAETLAQQRAQLRGERAYVIAAPIAGRVAALQTAVGRTAEPSMPIMVIVPERSSLRAEVYAPTRAVGFVQPGQEVRLLYDAFPYQRFGSFAGRISRVSRIAIDPREVSAPLRLEEAVYRIEVEPAGQSVQAFGRSHPLQPGMALSANIIIERRSFLGWLLTPINAVLRRNA